MDIIIYKITETKENSNFVRKKFLTKVNLIQKNKFIPSVEEKETEVKLKDENSHNYENQKKIPSHPPLKIGETCPFSNKPHLHSNDSKKPPIPGSSTNAKKKDLHIITNFCHCFIKKHHYSMNISDYNLKKLSALKGIETPGSSNGGVEDKESINWPELKSFGTSEELESNDLIDKNEIHCINSSGSSTPHLYTDYKARLNNLLLKNFGHSDDNEPLSDTIESVSSDSES